MSRSRQFSDAAKGGDLEARSGRGGFVSFLVEKEKEDDELDEDEDLDDDCEDHDSAVGAGVAKRVRDDAEKAALYLFGARRVKSEVLESAPAKREKVVGMVLV